MPITVHHTELRNGHLAGVTTTYPTATSTRRAIDDSAALVVTAPGGSEVGGHAGGHWTHYEYTDLPPATPEELDAALVLADGGDRVPPSHQRWWSTEDLRAAYERGQTRVREELLASLRPATAAAAPADEKIDTLRAAKLTARLNPHW